MKHIKITFFTVFLVVISAIASFGYSPSWYQEDGHWRVRGADGNPIKNTCFIDRYDTNIDGPEYFLDSSGNMVVGVLRDTSVSEDSITQLPYILCIADPGEKYGAATFESGYYGGIYVEFKSNGSIASKDTLDALIQKYGLTEAAINDFIYSTELDPDPLRELFYDNAEGRAVTKEEAYNMFRQSLDEFGFQDVVISDASNYHPQLEYYSAKIEGLFNISCWYTESAFISGNVYCYGNNKRLYKLQKSLTSENLKMILSYAVSGNFGNY